MGHMNTHSQDVARTNGYTKYVFASSWVNDFELLVKPDTDFDDTFVAYDLNTGHLVALAGWKFEIEEISQ